MLTNFQVFSKWAYTTAIEKLAFNIALFNTATRGGFVLGSGANVGDFTDQTMYSRINGLVRRRDAYGDGDVASKQLAMLLETSVKVAAGTPPIDIDPHWWQWIQRSPEEAGVKIGQQLSEDMLADMVAVAIKAYVSVIGNIAALTHDATAAALSLTAMNTGASKFGDRAQAITCWVMHSTPVHDVYAAALANSNTLFNFGTVQVRQDGFGRPFIMTDQPDLQVADGVASGIDLYRTLGLSAGAVALEKNNDFIDNVETKNGKENITRTWQAQWSYNVAVKGFAWNKDTGGKSPTNAALATASNWTRYATSDKDLAGVLIKSR